MVFFHTDARVPRDWRGRLTGSLHFLYRRLYSRDCRRGQSATRLRGPSSNGIRILRYPFAEYVFDNDARELYRGADVVFVCTAGVRSAWLTHLPHGAADATCKNAGPPEEAVRDLGKRGCPNKPCSPHRRADHRARFAALHETESGP